MSLQSKLFRGDAKLEAAAQVDSAHIVPGARGAHVGKIQQALIELDGAKIARDEIYGPGTAAAVLAYKRKRNIINTAYQTQADNIVGKMTMARLDSEMLARESKPTPPGPIPPGPTPPPDPTPHLNLSFSMTDPSIYVTLEGGEKVFPAAAIKVVEPSSFLGSGKIKWADVSYSGKYGRFKVEKKGVEHWVIMFVPTGTNFFHKGHIFFHPTPVQVFPDPKNPSEMIRKIVADDKNYASFGTDWQKFAADYLAFVAPQLGAAKKMTLIMPMMRATASQNSNASNDVFADRPLETIEALLKAARLNLSDLTTSTDPTDLSGGLATSSFSNGISYHANLFNRISGSGKLLEAFDFDSTFITSAHKDISASPSGPVITRHTQFENQQSISTAVHFPKARWDAKAANAPEHLRKQTFPITKVQIHHLIINYTFHGAIAGSRILSG